MDKMTFKVEEDGSQRWYKNGKAHRDDGPVYIHRGGTQFWYKNNVSHRDNGPADIWDNGVQRWYKNGKPQWIK